MNAENLPEFEGPMCPLPLPHSEQILLGHGSGGKLMHDLISQVFMPPLHNPFLAQCDDASVIPILDELSATPSVRLAFSTDSHVVTPLFFPGGDIGKLAVCGTVNDLAMMGATPRYLTAGFILEEGLEVEVLTRVLHSMRQAAEEARVLIVAGDTKVVEKGKADGMYINTAGIGVIEHNLYISGNNAQPGDVILLSGTIGNHGIAVLEARQELGFSSHIQSDIAPLNTLVEALIHGGIRIHAMRDPTRGGLATTLNEIAAQSKVGMLIHEEQIPIQPEVASVCEMLGFDPLYIANEGVMITIVAKDDAPAALEVMRASKYGTQAAIIGEVLETPVERVLMKTAYGSTRVVDTPSGEILPRIC